MLTYETTRNIRQLVQDAASVYTDHVFIKTLKDGVEHNTTFAKFAEEMEAVSAWTEKQSEQLGHPARIAMVGGNSPIYVKMQVGVMCGGGISVLLDPQAGEETLARCMKKAEADILFYDDSLEIDIEQIKIRYPELEFAMKMDESEKEGCCGKILADYAGKQATNTICENDCAVIIFTSGTTGEEKGVMLSHLNLTNSVFNTSHAKFGVKLSVLPMHHAFCLNSDILISFGNCTTLCINGGMANLMDNLLYFEPKLINVVPMVAQTLYNKMVLLAKQQNKTIEEVKYQVLGNRMQKIVAGGAHLPSELVEKYQNIGIFLCQGYGMTESAPTIASPDMSRKDKAHTAGRVVLRCKTRVVDGELQVSSPSVMLGYVNAPELTAQVITEDGWLRTGDIGYEDEEGFLHITGRVKNLIILSNGENVSPEQIENLLLDHQLIEECLVYGEGNQIAAELFPNSKYAALHKIEDVPLEIEKIVQSVNQALPSYKKVMKYGIRKVALKRTGTGKIIRAQRASADQLLNIKEEEQKKKPQTDIQKKIYEIVSEVMEHKDFGIDTDLFMAGLDSLGCIMTLASLSEKLQFSLGLDEFMANPTIEYLAKRYEEKSIWDMVDHSVRPIYGMSGVQMSFAYVMRGNTTSNIPILLKLDNSVDLKRLQKAILGLFDIHPILKDVVQMIPQKGYANFRDDSRSVTIPILEKTKEEWQNMQDSLVRPYMYQDGEPLYHIELYRVEEEQYLFFDIAHIISDGMSVSMLIEDMNRLYHGEVLEPETYTYYDFLVDHEHRMKLGLHLPNIKYYCELMHNKRGKRSILNRAGHQNLEHGENAALRGSFQRINQEKVQDFCYKNAISENVFFLTAFNYLISMYSDNDDTISSSIHNGRTDSRWGHIAGCLFSAYNFRKTFWKEETVMEAVKSSAKQIMETMRCYLKNPHADEMFFQYQGTLMNFAEVAGAKAQNIPLKLDSLPFHLMVYNSNGGYIYELRYWENRFAGEQLQIFIDALDAVLEGMLYEKQLKDVRTYIPECLYPQTADIKIIDRYGNVQPIGAWGTLYQNGENVGRIARILTDGSVDYLEESGRCVLVENMMGRNYPDLQKIEDIAKTYPDVTEAEAFSYYWKDNNIALVLDISCDKDINQESLKAFLEEKLEKKHMPQYLFKNGSLWE